MARTVYLGGSAIRLEPAMVFGEGGEAEIFKEGKRILKVWKKPNHPDFAGRVLRDMSKSSSLLTTPFPEVMDLFRDLHATVTATHGQGVVFGDFNNLNVLAHGTEAYVLDADSMQFGKFPCRTFMGKFVDPKVCDPKETKPVQILPHSAETDWYAFCVMLFESLLFVPPFGGVFRSRSVKHDERPLRGISVFHPDVKLPGKATPFERLSDDLLEYFKRIFEEGLREAFPMALLERVQWAECSGCGIWHSRAKCPTCSTTSPVPAMVETVFGELVYNRVFQTEGLLVHAKAEGGSIAYIYHEDGAFFREGGKRLFSGEVGADLRLRIAGPKTIIARGTQAVITDGKDKPSRLTVDLYRDKVPMIDSAGGEIHWISGGTLYSEGEFAPKAIGKVMEGQTLFWSGPKFGFGFYRAGQISVAFVFENQINDSVKVEVKGQLLDATAYFTDSRCWFLTVTKQGSELVHSCYLLSRKGEVLAKEEAIEDDGSWLGSSIRGKTAATIGSGKTHCLFSIGEEGIVRIDEENGLLREKKSFPEAADTVNPSHHIFFTKGGITVVKRKETGLLTIKPTG